MNQKNLTIFYDKYHKSNKNGYFSKVITRNNFTYFPIIRMLDKHGLVTSTKIHSILDVGCGVGPLSFFLASQMPEVTVKGIDISKKAISIAEKYRDISSLRNITFERKDILKDRRRFNYDFVICSEVIEHVLDDKKLLRHIWNNMNHHGVLLITTPSVQAPLYRLGLLKQFDSEVGHLRRYSVSELTRMIETSNFEIVDIVRSEGIFRNTLFTMKPFGLLIKLIKGPLVPIFHFFDRIAVYAFGESNIYILARKKSA